MPVRNSNVGGSDQPLNEQPSFEAKSNPEDDWDALMKVADSTKVGRDENGFDRMSTSFYLKDDEELEIMFLSDYPTMFNGHAMKRFSKNNTEYYTKEPCQKSAQSYCLYCDEKYNVQPVVAFPILDPRGTYDRQTKEVDASKPCPKLFLTSVAFAKIIKKTRDDVGGTLMGKVMKLTRANKNYSISAAMVPDRTPGTFRYKTAPAFTGAIPDAASIYSPDPDATVQNVINTSAKPADMVYNKGGAAGGANTAPKRTF